MASTTNHGAAEGRSDASADASASALTVVLGGARSGKSSLVVRWGRASDVPVVFVATGEARDEEMRDRITRHRADRPGHWTTVEEPRDIVGAVTAAPAEAFLIVDCLTLWVANVLDRQDAEVVANARAFAAVAARRAAPTIVVSNEVGLGIVPVDAMTRRYRDLLGAVNAAVVAHAAAAWLLVAGRAVPLGPLPARPTG